jgi:SpoVK/Ycf46/Vps4 family AAA+-type ATPase
LQTECNAIVLDLSPSNIENKYTDKPEYMLNLAFKVAVSFQPSIIYIDEVEKIFKV